MEKKRVLILSTGVGTGHIRAADALEKAFRADDRAAEVINVDALDYGSKLLQELYSGLNLVLARSAPTVLGWWYGLSDESRRTDGMRRLIDRVNTFPLIDLVRSFVPHIIVCTHFMPAGIISHLIAKGRLRTNLAIVVTDLDFHAMWLSRGFHRYFVALEEAKAHLVTLGIPEDRITVSGIPIDPVFARPLNRCRQRRKLGLDPEKPVLLVSAGAWSATPVELLVERLFRLRHEAQLIIVCGRNGDLRKRVGQLVRTGPQPALVIGYSERIAVLMQVSDVFIGKPGGLTTAEALASGLPMCIVSPIPGQEERNSDHLLEEGVAVRCNDLATLPFKIDRLLADPDRLADMKANALRLARPRAAETIAATLLADDLAPCSVPEPGRLAHVRRSLARG